jgi:glucokinase
MNQHLAIGIDVGGTKLAFALVTPTGQVLSSYRLPTHAPEGSVVDRIAEGVAYLIARAEAPIDGIGIGCPGQVDTEGGVVRYAINMGWDEVQLGAELRARLPASERDRLTLAIDRDANAAAVGEMYFGAAQGRRHFTFLALGTGFGAGSVVDGRLIRSRAGLGMEVGHIMLDPNGRLCRCGLHGCPEMYASGIGVMAGYAAHQAAYPDSCLSAAESITTADILNAAAQADPLAVKILDEAGEWLGMVMALCGAALNPPLFLLGGGLGHAAAPYLIERALTEFRRRTLPNVSAGVTLGLSQVTNSAIGAASLVWAEQNAQVID